MNIRRHHLALAGLVLVVGVVAALNLPSGDDPVRAAGAWVTVSAGARITCALDRRGAVGCWGAAHGAPPAGLRLRRLSVGADHACGITTAGTLRCWGRDYRGSTRPPSGTFVALSAGWDYACAVREGGRVACWGWNQDGQAAAPTGRFSSVAAGYHHTCGVRRDGEVACWGVNLAGQGDAPAGPFEQVAVAQCHSCGLRPSGKVACWGCDMAGGGKPRARTDTRDGRNTPPGGRLRTLSAGFLHTCGVSRADGAVRCWGHNAAGQSAPPPGPFADADAGFFHTCGVTARGSLECWGWREPVLAVPGQKKVLARAQARPVAPGAPVPGMTDHVCPYEGMGLLYLRQGRSREALRSLGQATEIVSHLEYRKLVTMARRHIEKGERAEAQRLLRKAHAAITPQGERGATADDNTPAPTSMPPKCKTDTECPSRERCYQPHGRCYTRCGEGNRSCPPGRPCDRRSGLCRPPRPPCARAADCKGDQFCSVDGCLPRCSAASPACPEGFLCDVFLEHCRVHPARCPRGARCTRGRVCHPGHRRCYARCSERAPCTAGMICEKQTGACVPRGAPCTERSHCGAGQRCFIQGCLTRCSGDDAVCPAGKRCNGERGICE